MRGDAQETQVSYNKPQLHTSALWLGMNSLEKNIVEHSNYESETIMESMWSSAKTPVEEMEVDGNTEINSVDIIKEPRLPCFDSKENILKVAEFMIQGKGTDAYSIGRVSTACTKAKVLHKVVFEMVDRKPKNPQWIAKLYIDSTYFAECKPEKNKKMAKHKVYQIADQKLRRLNPDFKIIPRPAKGEYTDDFKHMDTN